jgi:hypothetical protein
MASIAPRRPLRSAAPFAVLAAVALAFVADPRLPWFAPAAGAAPFAAAAGLRGLQARRDLRRRRAAADRLILAGSALAVWRVDELTSRAMREGLRRDVERTLRALSPDRLPSASPLNRTAARRNEALLGRLAERLDSGEDVSPRGVLLARALLRDDDSPLYNDGVDLLLPRALTRILGALEP